MHHRVAKHPAMLAAAIALSAAGRAYQQPGRAPAPRPTGAISGVILDGSTNAPIAGAVVSLGLDGAARDPAPERQLTDSKGRFVFSGLSAGNGYYLRASAAGYLDGSLGSPNSANSVGGPIAIGDGQWFGAAKLPLWKPGAISGTVVDERGEPVAGVFVRTIGILQVMGRTQLAAGPVTLTDDRGAYRIAGLVPGRYYVAVPSVQSSAPPTSTLSATAALLPRVPGGPAGPSSSLAGDAALDLDPRARLVINHYPVPPPVAGGRTMTYPMSFYPAAAAIAQAGIVELGYGDERRGIDVRLEPVPAGRIAGTLQGPIDPSSRTPVRLVPSGLEELGIGSEAATATAAADGSFVLLNVPAGSYTIDVPITLNEFQIGSPSFQDPMLPSAPGGPNGWSSSSEPGAPAGTSFKASTLRASGAASHYWSRTPINVDGSDTTVVVTMHAGVKIDGSVVFDYDPKQPKPATPPRITLLADGATGETRLGRPRLTLGPDSGYGFEFADLMFAAYFLRVASFPPGWAVKSIVADGHEMRDAPLDTSSGADFDSVTVTVTNATATLTGKVRDGGGATAPGAVVLVFPADRSGWTNYGLSPTRIKTTRAASDGTYRFTALPAGDYELVAMTGGRADAWQAPGFFAAAEAVALHATAGWGESKTVDLKASEIRAGGGTK